MNNWAVGDMCFFEFSLSSIVEMKGENITEISDGYFRTSTGDGFNDRCFPISLEIKLISDEYDRQSKKIHEDGLRGLNFPDIHRWLVHHWSITCSKPSDAKWLKQRYSELDDSVDEIFAKQRELETYYTKTGFYLLRQ